MVKQTKNKPALPQRKTPNPPKKRPNPSKGPGGLDNHARAYAALLTNPCNAPLVPSCYAGSSGGIIMRFENDFIVNSSATDTNALVYFVPGAWSGSSGTIASVFQSTGAITSDASGVPTTKIPSRQPAYGFEGNVSAFRVLSACLQVSYIGSELSRSGVLAVGQTTYAGSIGVSSSTASLRSMANTVERVPDGVVEVKMRPNAQSEQFIGMINAGYPDGYLDQPVLFAAMAGIPVSTGMRCRCVSVIEWVPAAGPGIISRISAAPSENTLNHVLRWLDNNFPNWDVKLLASAGALIKGAFL